MSKGSSFDRIFPVQDRLDPGDVGNLIALPFNGLAAKRGTTLLLDVGNGLSPHGADLAENIEYFLENLTTINEPEVDHLLKTLGVDQVDFQRDSGTTFGQYKGNERLLKLVEACAFLRHCRDDAGTLPEPEWYQGICLLANQYGGPDLIHKLSLSYPKYSKKETNAKILHALHDCPGPPTCSTIQKDWPGCDVSCGVTTPLGLLFAQREPEPAAHIEIPSPPRRSEPDWPAPLAPEAFYGLAGEFVKIVGPATEADPAALLVQFLAAFGNLVGRTAYFIGEADRHYSNINAVIVGATASGKKGSSHGWVRNTIEAVDETWKDRVTGGISSGEGIIWQVRDPIMKMEKDRKTGKMVETAVDEGVSDKRLYLVEAEFASVLRVCTRDGNTVSAIIRCRGS